MKFISAIVNDFVSTVVSTIDTTKHIHSFIFVPTGKISISTSQICRYKNPNQLKIKFFFNDYESSLRELILKTVIEIPNGSIPDIFLTNTIIQPNGDINIFMKSDFSQTAKFYIAIRLGKDSVNSIYYLSLVDDTTESDPSRLDNPFCSKPIFSLAEYIEFKWILCESLSQNDSKKFMEIVEGNSTAIDFFKNPQFYQH
jgi:hypothetical protein